MAYAGFDDVRVDQGDLDEQQRPQVETLLERAESQVRRAFPDLEARIADGRTDEVLVVQVEAEMVAAVLRNPDAVQSRTEGVGPYSRSFTVNLEAASGLLRLTAAHRAMLGELPLRGPYTVSLGG